MKKKIHINWKVIAIIILFIWGMYCVVVGASRFSKCEKAVSFDELAYSDIEDGAYVCGYISNFVIRREMVNDTPVKSAVSQTLIDFKGESDIYTIPVKEEKYIQLMARNDNTKKELENMLEDTSDKAYFEGIIEKKNIEVNEAWYGAVDERVYPGINNIISGYYIREIDKEDYWNNIRTGAILVLLAVLLFIDGGGFESLIDETVVQPKLSTYKTFEFVNDKDDELVNRENILRHLKRRQKRIKKKKTGSIIMLILGIVSIILLPKLILVGITLLLFGGKGCLEWFINSSNIYGIKLARKIGYDSLYLMIEQCKRDIKELEELVYNEQKDQGIDL
ncbi:MAG: hypothetical protein IJD58_04975 [Lachnospiraceae bacterium]|nr:hypothetical protein [Lachnospiraceae bacterium]